MDFVGPMAMNGGLFVAQPFVLSGSWEGSDEGWIADPEAADPFGYGFNRLNNSSGSRTGNEYVFVDKYTPPQMYVLPINQAQGLNITFSVWMKSSDYTAAPYIRFDYTTGGITTTALSFNGGMTSYQLKTFTFFALPGDDVSISIVWDFEGSTSRKGGLFDDWEIKGERP